MMQVLLETADGQPVATIAIPIFPHTFAPHVLHWQGRTFAHRHRLKWTTPTEPRWKYREAPERAGEEGFQVAT